MAFVAEPGKVLEGRYVLRAPLGQGGMGTVWRAEHTQLKTAVAIKLVAASIASTTEGRARFRREAQVAAALESANIVRILDFGLADDTPFIAMELLAGETLGARLARDRALSPEVVIRIAGQVARGIMRAHQAHVVHCDLKPENVFLATVDGEEVAKLLDFGVAKAPLFDPLTQTGAVLGTLQYMSPEQLEGRRGVDTRSDLYSLAVIVFECICGQPAFGAESIAELVRRICGAPLPLPSSIAKVPEAFDAWFIRAAHRDPAARFSSAREMVDALASTFDRNAAHSAVMSSAPRKPIELQHTVGVSRSGGNEKAGFRIAPNPRERILELEFWGFWTMETALSFRSEVLAAYEEMPTKTWSVLSHARKYGPQRDDVQAVHRECMAMGMTRGLSRVAVLIDIALGKMQVRRLFEEAGSPSYLGFFTDENEARAWLASRGRRGGDERAGFRIDPDLRTRLVEIERWGLWEIPTAEDFKKQLLEVCAEMKGAPWVALSFATRHPPQNPEVQRLQGDTMAVAKSYGVVRAAMVAESALAAMAVRRLAQENHMDVARVFTDEREARAWLGEIDLSDPKYRG